MRKRQVLITVTRAAHEPRALSAGISRLPPSPWSLARPRCRNASCGGPASAAAAAASPHTWSPQRMNHSSSGGGEAAASVEAAAWCDQWK